MIRATAADRPGGPRYSARGDQHHGGSGGHDPLVSERGVGPGTATGSTGICRRAGPTRESDSSRPRGSDYWASFVDRNVSNGTTYYYAVSAVDRDGNESDLSQEAVHDTPRPAGQGLRLSSYETNPRDSAYDFSRYTVTDYDDPDADIAFIHSPDAGELHDRLERPERSRSIRSTSRSFRTPASSRWTT